MITGAGGAIGYACARAFAERGADLILSDNDGQALELASSNLRATGRFCDVASEASVAVFLAGVLKTHASIDVLINAAGKSYVRNLGTMRVTRAFLPMMKSDGRKKDIVNIASMARRSTDDGGSFPYAASQEAFERLSEALAENIRGTNVALTTVIPRSIPSMEDGVDSPAIAPSLGFEHFDPDRVAAAVIDAVQSSGTRQGQTLRLTGPLVSRTREGGSGTMPFGRRAGKQCR